MRAAEKNIRSQSKLFGETIAALRSKFDPALFSPEMKRIRLSQTTDDDLAFAKIYFPSIFNEPWNALHYFIAGLQRGNYTVSGARKFGKSAFVYVAKVIKRLVTGGAGIVNINLRTLENSKERTAAIISLIRSNRLLAYDFEPKITLSRRGRYIVNGKYLVATSVNTGLRGILDENFKRFELSVNDDLYNKNSVMSERDNEKVVSFITSEIYGQMEENGLSITLGNSISADCPVRRLAEMFPDNHFSLPALDREGKSNWRGHSVFTDEYWIQKQKEIPYDIWMGEYMDSPLKEGNVFRAEWIRALDPASLKNPVSITAIDPSSGKSLSANYKGIASLILSSEGVYVCDSVELTKDDYLVVFDIVKERGAQLPGWKGLYFENDFSQWQYAKPYFELWRKKHGNIFPVILFNSSKLKTAFYSSSKEQRIMNLVFPHQTGSFYYSPGFYNSRSFEIYREQYLSFGNGKSKTDGLDALASAFILLNNENSRTAIKTVSRKPQFSREDWLNRS